MILVTGGTGNVGANVVSQLLDAGEKVSWAIYVADWLCHPTGIPSGRWTTGSTSSIGLRAVRWMMRSDQTFQAMQPKHWD
ncbi:hypothetical protein ALI144C_06985 [Actinosynnema sp. ALI-1.44]|uniref:NAD(P)-dependent oxidoreductase n=1 Tax=Actinosynnema sp. ALI-1.44 TaxID=1933779 RepID=UPI00097C188B|nr:NAD(P)-dependent oxidoreductase [Actinosynnema sp. ALI-1.44]ONI88194.1 hypothetical protein ALI144C_06985 [Actinosynnema sp. ALI-1.44]